MLEILKSLLAIGAAMAAQSARRTIGTLAGMACALGLAAVSVMFFTIAGYRGLERTVGDIYAPTIMGCCYLVASLIALLVVQSRRT